MSNLNGPAQFLVTRGDWAAISFKHCIIQTGSHEFQWNFNQISLKKNISKCDLLNVGHFVSCLSVFSFRLSMCNYVYCSVIKICYTTGREYRRE